MKIVSEQIFLRKGDYYLSDEFNQIMSEVNLAIESVTWHDPQRFVINPIKKANGVNPIKAKFVEYLSQAGWKTEQRWSIGEDVGPGPIDGIKVTENGIFAVEWETGNISSSHRALNKMYLGIKQKKLLGGILVLPVRQLAKLLTDRIGNLEEITPYFPVYEGDTIDSGFLGIIGFTYDDVSAEAPIIPKGKDGNAKKDIEETPLGL